MNLILLIAVLILLTLFFYYYSALWRARRIISDLQGVVFGRNRDQGDLLDAVKALKWEVHSYRSEKKSGELPEELESIVSAIAQKGKATLSVIPDVIARNIRAQCIGIVVSDLNELETHFNRDPGMDEDTVRLLLNSHISRSVKPVVSPVMSSLPLEEGSRIPLFPRWNGVETVTLVRERCSSRSELLLLVGSPSQAPLLEREKTLLLRLATRIVNALNEFHTVQLITDKAEKEIRKQEEQVAFVSHDMRSPLNNIRGILDLLYLESSGGKNHELLQVARANCVSLREIVEGLLEYARYREEGVVVATQDFLLEDLVEDTVQEFVFTAEQKGISLQFLRESHSVVRADPKHIKRILHNVLNNALKYTEEGTITLSIQQSKEWIELTVSDTGIGIPKDKIDTLFTPFTRGGEVKAEGVGLGLALAKFLIESNRGEILCESAHGEGTIFRLLLREGSVLPGELPSELPHEDLPIKRAESIKAVYSQDARLLLIDDDRDATATLSRILDRFGYTVQAINTLDNLEGTIRFFKPDFLISDVHMPGGGIEEVFRINEGFGTPILVVSGTTDSLLQKRLKENGVCKVFLKPVDPEDILCALEEYSERGPSNQEGSSGIQRIP